MGPAVAVLHERMSNYTPKVKKRDNTFIIDCGVSLPKNIVDDQANAYQSRQNHIAQVRRSD